MTRLTVFFLIAALPAAAQSITSDPIGFNKVTCLSNSDTIVGIPLHVEGSHTTKLAADPTTNPDGSVTLTVTATFTADAFPRHFVKFVGASKDGCWYDITANDTRSITINLNGDNLAGVVAGGTLVVAEHWSLGTLFNPALSTTDPTTTGNAIVASTGYQAFQRRTEVLLPDLVGTGVNLAPTGKYYIASGHWRRSGDPTYADMDGLMLNPDNYFIIRHPGSVTANTTFRSLGEVNTRNWTIALATLTDGQQDTFIALPRPVPLTLGELNLWQSGAFMVSTGVQAFQRRDVLLVFDNAAAAQNKAPIATYYHNGSNWLKVNDGTTAHDEDIIPAGIGFIVRKYRTATGATSFWKNIPTY